MSEPPQSDALAQPADPVGSPAAATATGPGAAPASPGLTAPLARAAPLRPDGRLDLDAVVGQYQTALLRYAGQLLSPRGGDGPGAAPSAEVEDVVQEAFLRLHRYVTDGDGPPIQNLTSWLFRVTHNLTMDARRRRQRQQKLQAKVAQDAAAEPAAPNDAALGELERQEACGRAMGELHKLPEEQRQVLLLKVVQGLTLREVAAITGQSIGNVAYRMNQGLRELAKRLKAGGVI